ncbi:leishmanolysin family protein, putative [Ichthyophthirius multifiliis]|uniref:Leishmanolysin family protein, putative n=1 Tax=Ichthyophthirius multifiliis TaxID=5932 RepID=G0R0P2_ICHMU|nr:leishmanolysin family protein, putative [Ichthyophthirius multifiliis]EGR28964.1 leishmanolysin family protein, putative [Ichthyophthirius multifiliis]|eukprot:XP_004030200.1 leishmanolysin family protein, putative [Ichthyophthirius multifiliis]
MFPKNSSIWKLECLGVRIPTSAVTIGIPNSDLNIYVIAKNAPQDKDIANACVCAHNEQHLRPSFGRIQINFGVFGLKDDNESFENDLETIVHEILHVLGFSGFQMQLWIDPDTGKYYGQYGLPKITRDVIIRGLKTSIVYSKNILLTARKYYNCPTMEGMQLENEGGSGSLGSHWEQLLVQNEMMMSSDVITDAQLSVHTIALLKDTGYFAEVNENMADNLYWGKGKGCSFVMEGCYSKQKFNEFPSERKIQCSFENDGYGEPTTTPFLDNCMMKNVDAVLEVYGFNSKCFTSTSANGVKFTNDSQRRCHQYQCSPDLRSITITFPQIKRQVICTKEGSVMQIVPNNDRYGKIACPSSFIQFCDSVPICMNHCSQVGVCVRGICSCLPGWGGIDCSVKLIGPDRSCQTNCPNGYYKHGNICQQCDAQCKRCNGGTANNCTACQFLTQLNRNGQCVPILN